MKKVVKLLLSSLLMVLFLVACGEQKEQQAATNDTPIVIGQTFVIGAVEPTVGGTPWSLTTHGLSETVFSLDRSGNLVSRYVDDVERTDALNWVLKLKKDVKFSDGTEVNADALAWAMNTVMEENPLSNATAGKVKFEKVDDYTVNVTTERETQNLKALLAEWTNIIFKKTDSGYVFTGPFVVKNLEPEVSLTLEPNQYYENADKRGEVVIKAMKDMASMKLAFESGELDMAFGITPEIAEELKTAGKIVEPIDAGYQYFGIFNTASGAAADKTVREALNLGLDREDYLKALKGGRVANGLFAQYYSFAGDVKVEYNVEKANALLDEAGWVMNKDGMREKDGKVLTLNLLTYNSRPDLKTIMQVMVSQLKKMGIDSKTSIVDAIDTEAAKKQFDLILYAQHTAPTGTPVYFLNQFFRTNGSKNHMSYSSKEVDALLDKLGTLKFGDELINTAKEIQGVIYKDAPVLFLVDPEWNVALSERLKDYKVYNGDYYIVNSELYK